MRLRAALALLLALPVLPALAGQTLIDVGRGPVAVEFPSTYDPARPLPLVIGLHGYTNTGDDFGNYFQLAGFAESEGFLYANPTGTTDAFGNPFWNATDACCNLFGSGVDDVAYLLALIEAIRDQFAVDPWRVHFTGWSNGAFMSFRMSCDRADLVASMAGQSGATFLDPADCVPVGPVHTLQIHGTSDGTIAYGGGTIPLGGTYPGAVLTSDLWAANNGCDPAPETPTPNFDLDAGIAGAESTRRRFTAGCREGGSTRLWTVPGGPHRIDQTTELRERLVGFLLGHRKAGLVFTDATTLDWPPLYWAADYRVYRGSTADLFDTDADGLIEAGYGDCVGATAATTFADPTVPPPGEGLFYLVGFEDADGVDSMLGTVPNGAARLPATVCP